jgi:Aspartyl protease
MLIYAKFFKDILSNRRKLEEVQVISLINLPKKLDDPKKFAISCSIGKVQFKCALCDLGASVSLIPKSIFDKIEVGELKPTRISLQMADQSVKLPIGVVVDMPIQIGKYFVPIDFVIIDVEEDVQTPLFLDRPFLNTTKAVIDVHEGMISFKIGDEKITFQINRVMKYLYNEKSIFKIDVIDALLQEELQRDTNERPLERLLDDRDLSA